MELAGNQCSGRDSDLSPGQIGFHTQRPEGTHPTGVASVTARCPESGILGTNASSSQTDGEALACGPVAERGRGRGAREIEHV